MGLFLSNEQRRLVQEASPLLAQFLANIGKGDLAAANMILTPASGEDKTASTDNTTTVTAIDQQKNKKTANEAGCGSYMQEQSRMARCPARGMPPDHNTQVSIIFRKYLCQNETHVPDLPSFCVRPLIS